MWHPDPPRADKALLLVFAGDHGLTEEGVSQYPSAVTAAMVRTFLAGRASANAFATAVGVDIKVVDAGVAIDMPDHPRLTVAKVRHGTANAAHQAAMTPADANTALSHGYRVACEALDAGIDLIAIGEMGIGNSASAALLMHRLAPAPLRDCVGSGAGQDGVGMVRKLAVLERAAARTSASTPLEVLTEFGGLEIAMMTGAIFGAALRRRPVVVDGFIASAAALVAIRIQPAARDYCVFAHRSAERGHGLLLDSINAMPLLDLGMRLGEGTGAVLAVPILRAAAHLLSDVASLQDVLAGKI
jgi:nicotinate-nucleotide--dimethylbenzimidazole phosphoribosyltransferase